MSCEHIVYKNKYLFNLNAFNLCMFVCVVHKVSTVIRQNAKALLAVNHLVGQLPVPFLSPLPRPKLEFLCQNFMTDESIIQPAWEIHCKDEK